MRIAVCDDNSLFLEEIKNQLHSLSMAEDVSLFSNLDKFLISIDAGRRYDVVLMDINWNEKRTGMDVALELYNLCPETKIIYVTGFLTDYVQQIFLKPANLSGYLMKPVDVGLLKKNLEKILRSVDVQEQPLLVLKQKGKPIPIPMRDILYIQSQGQVVQVHTMESIVKVYDRLENILGNLSKEFCQCHKSFVVNMSQIRRFLTNDLLLKNNDCIPVSRTRYRMIKDTYFDYMGKTK